MALHERLVRDRIVRGNPEKDRAGRLDLRKRIAQPAGMIETAHGAEVEVKSEAGRGTRVIVVVPRRQCSTFRSPI